MKQGGGGGEGRGREAFCPRPIFANVSTSGESGKIELKVYLFLKTVEQSKQFEHKQLWISGKGGTTKSLRAWKVKSSYKVKDM